MTAARRRTPTERGLDLVLLSFAIGLVAVSALGGALHLLGASPV